MLTKENFPGKTSILQGISWTKDFGLFDFFEDSIAQERIQNIGQDYVTDLRLAHIKCPEERVEGKEGGGGGNPEYEEKIRPAHEEEVELLNVLRLKHFKQTFLFLGLGLGTATVTFFVEILLNRSTISNLKKKVKEMSA